MAGERKLRRVAGVTVVLAGSVWALAAHADETCPSKGSERVQLAGVEARLELRLTDGRLVRLVGLDPAQSTPISPGRDEAARAALAKMIDGRLLAITVLSETPDRWGRIEALAFADGSPPLRVAEAAIAAGLGRYRSEPAAHACRNAWVAAEAAARATKLGLWADPYYAVLAVVDPAGFAERTGTLVVVEARLAAVKDGSYRTKLIFADRQTRSHGGQALSATILPRTKTIFEARGVHVSSLIGRTLRLRGLLDLRFGPEIELTDPDDLDVLPPAPETAPLAPPAGQK